MAADNVIDESVVRISPDLKGFRRDLQAKLKAAVAGVTAKVKLQADATGWAASVRKELAARPQATAKVRLVADARSFQRSINEALRARGGVHGMVGAGSGGGAGTGGGGTGGGSVKPSFGERGGLANALHINERITQNLREHLSRRRNLQEGYEADRTRAQDADLQRQLKRFRSYQEMIDHLHAQGDAWELRRTRSAAEEHARVREAAFKAEEKLQQDAAVKRQRIEERYSTFQEKVNGELHAMSTARADDERRIAGETEDARHRIDLHGLTLRRQVLAAGEAADKESNKRSEQEQKKSLARRATAKPSAALKATEGNGIIDLGGQGIKPSNIPLAALAALSPALLSIASSATLAASSVAAIGAAGIGAAAGVTALVIGFSRIREALTLRQQVRKEEQRSTIATAESAAAERSRARAIVMGNRSVRDSIRSLAEARRSAADADKAAGQARADINVAYRDAAQYVRDLREQLSDLARQEQQDALDVASAKDRLASVNNNFWATDLEKRQAALDVQKALDDQSDNKRDEVAKRKELNKLDRDGIGQSKQVLEARQRAADAERAAVDAHRAVAAAQERVTDAQYDLTEAKRADTDATTKATAASKDLAAKIASLSSAAREMYYWFKNNEGMLDKLRSKMEQAVLPGFLTFLREITDRGKRGRGTSSLDIMADSAANLGKIAGTTAGKLGKLTKSPWFRRDMAKINTENEKSFTLLGDASLAFVKPLTTIIAAASPLFTRFSKWLLKITDQFAAFIDKADKNGTLVQWFKDAGDEAAKWGGILRNLLGFLKSVFTASLPSGKDLVTRIGDATAQLDKWGKSPKGKKELAKFFKSFQDLPYGKIAKFVGSFGLLIVGLKTFTFGRKHPFYALMALLAAKYPAETADLLSKVANGMRDMLTWVDKHPGQAATVLAILTAVRYWKPISIGFKLLGLGEGLAAKIAAAFGKTTTATMHVTAGVVNVAGGGVAPGLPTPTGPAGKAPKAGLPGKIGSAAKGILPFLAALTDWPVLAVAVGTGIAFELAGKPFTWDPVADAQGMWKSFQQTLKEEADGATWDELKGAGKGIGHWFSTTLPDFISGQPGGGWSGAGTKVWTEFKDVIGVNAVTGLWAGITEKANWLWEKIKQFWKWLVDSSKKALGIASPSTVFAGIGHDLVSGLWQGFTEKWDGLLTTVKAFVTDKIGGPLKKAFDAVGVGARTAFVTPFSTLTDRLATPVGKALDWIDKNIIGKLNGVLAGIGVTTKIPNINSTLGDNVGKAAGNAISGVAGALGGSTARGLSHGGPVGGSSPHDRADNIHTMLTANEYVQPVDTVKHYGVGFMDAIRRKEIPRMAKGGLVEQMVGAVGGAKNSFVNAIAGKAIGMMGGDTLSAIAARVRGLFSPDGMATYGPGVAVPGFGHWPPNAASVHGHDSGVWRAIVRLVDQNHIPRNGFGAYNNRRTLRGGWSWHASGHAVDFSGYNQDQLAEFFMKRKPSVLELIHSTKKRNYGISRGHEHNMGSALWGQHKNHLHVAMAGGGLVPNVPMKSYDTGGALAPGVTLAVNGTGRTEMVRTAQQENNVNEPRRLDKRDIALLAQYIAAASQRPINMDGRRVAEIVHDYNYLPGGV